MRLMPALMLMCSLSVASLPTVTAFGKPRAEASFTSALTRLKAKLERLTRAYSKASTSVGPEVICRQNLGALETLYQRDLHALVQSVALQGAAAEEFMRLGKMIAQKRALTSQREFPFAEAQSWVNDFSQSAHHLLELMAAAPLTARPPHPEAPRARATIAPNPQHETGPSLDEDALDPVQREVLAFTDRKAVPSYRKILALEGMTPFKRYATDVIIDSQFRSAETTHSTYHCAFVGAPGTGKTTVARLYGSLLFELGLIGSNGDAPKFTEVSRTDLVGAHIGETEKKTHEFLRASLDGVLFIDEAHNLASGQDNTKDFGHRAVNVINKFMEDERDRLVIVFAGYREQMEAFINEDPGLRSRISRIIEFADFSDHQLLAILKGLYTDSHFSFDEGVLGRAQELLAAERQQEDQRGKNAFANGRAVRNLFERSLFAQKRRLFIEYKGAIDSIPPAARLEIKADDLE